ncbi:MAG: Ig-like domain-containing protein [Thermoplasmatota archaeon]
MRRHPLSSSQFVFLVASVLLLGALPVISLVAGGSRAGSDSEPGNNYSSGASYLDPGEVVWGSLMRTASDDTYDYYKINVPSKKVLNISMCILEWSPEDPGRVNFDLYAYNSGDYYSYIYSSTTDQWEAIIMVQPSGSTATIVICVYKSYYTSSAPGNYTISASYSDPFLVGTGSLDGYLNRSSPSIGVLYKLDQTIPDDKHLLAKLTCPSEGNFDVLGYTVWRYDGTWWLQNASKKNGTGNVEEIRMTGCEGESYIMVQARSGSGCYTLSLEIYDFSPDQNNVPSKAVLINDNEPRAESIDQGLDPVDWFVVNARANRTIQNVQFSLVGPGRGNTYYFSVRDRDFNILKNGSTYYGYYTSINLGDVSVQYDGPLYFVVKAVSHWTQTGEDSSQHYPAHHDYSVSMMLPNDAPFVNGTIPEVRMREDSTYDGLVLSEYFVDPEGRNMTYRLYGSGYKSRPAVNQTTGRVTFRPLENWFGAETVRFQATDSGPGNPICMTAVSVVVEPVNDLPYMASQLSDITMTEGSVEYTADLSAIFKDADDPFDNLTISCRVVSADTRPSSATLPIVYERAAHRYKLGPAPYFFGSLLLELSCTDGHEGTAPAVTEFFVNITHVNHQPSLSPSIPDPFPVLLREGGRDDHLNANELFTDPDTPEDYAADTLTYSLTIPSGNKVKVSIARDGRITFDAGEEEYIPDKSYEERVIITARDDAGLRAMLNITINIEPENDPPYFTKVTPEEPDVAMSENQKKSFSVASADIDTTELSYSWYLDGAKDKTAKGFTYTFSTDYNMGGRTYSLRVDVSDGLTTISFNWNISVAEVNRLPLAFIKSPTNMSTFKKGAYVSFSAEATDEDGDNLTFVWRDASGAELGRGASYSTNKLPKGTQTITLEVSDGKGSATQTVTIIVKDTGGGGGGGGLPGFGIGAALVAAACAVLLAWLRRR